MRKLTLILAMSSIVAYGQQNYGTVNLVKSNTEDSARYIQKAYYFFNQDSTALTYVCGGDVRNYYIKDEVKLAEIKRESDKSDNLFLYFTFIICAIVFIAYIYR